MDKPIDERLAQIETTLAHLDRLFEQLNQVVVEQAKTIARLQAQQRQLGETMQTLELERVRATNPKPPHYGQP